MKSRFRRWLRAIVIVVFAAIRLVALLYAALFAVSMWGRESIIVEDVKRYYRVHLPPSYDDEQPLPVVLAFHMHTGTGQWMEWTTHLNQIADQNDFIVVYPDGYKFSWADGSGQYAADQDQINDIAFVSTLIDELASSLAVDSNRVYVTGFSNGGFMAQRLACELSDKITAIASVGATLPKDIVQSCDPERPVPVMMINGLDDGDVPWEGTSEYTSVPATVENWTEINGCNGTPNVSFEPDRADDGTRVRREAYTACRDNANVVLYVIEGGGHAWPGGSKIVQLEGIRKNISQDIDASSVIWEFFQEYER